jgi:RHS repeat-associated protein
VIDHLHADERGSIIALSDAGGNVTAINRYDDYGMPQGGGITGRFGYTGQTWLPEITMWYYKARVYNPNTERAGGRFMQIDPAGYKDGPDWYVYVDGDPINLSDPTGRTITAQENDRRQIERLINARSGARYAFDKNGNLRRVGSPQSSPGSRAASQLNYYARRLDQAIKSERVISIRVQQMAPGPGDKPVNLDTGGDGGGVTIPDARGNQAVYISGNGARAGGAAPFVSSPADILAHELVGHAIPRIVGGGTGNAVRNENIVRREAGIPLRPDDPDHEE